MLHSASSAAVVECRLADELDLYLSLEAFDRAHEHVVGVVVGRRAGVRRDLVLVVPGADCQRITNLDPAGRCLPGCEEHVGPWLVHPSSRMVDPKGSEAEEAGLTVEQVPEDAR
jgi:hypothetical protein